jgi:hypothetical protein
MNTNGPEAFSSSSSSSHSKQHPKTEDEDENENDDEDENSRSCSTRCVARKLFAKILPTCAIVVQIREISRSAEEIGKRYEKGLAICGSGIFLRFFECFSGQHLQ